MCTQTLLCLYTHHLCTRRVWLAVCIAMQRQHALWPFDYMLVTSVQYVQRKLALLRLHCVPCMMIS